MTDQAPTRAVLPTLRTGGRIASINPQTFEEVQRLATMAVRAGIGHYSWKDTPEQMIAKATASIMHGMELGLSPMQSLSGIAVINGKTTIYGDLLTAVLWSNGFKVKMWTDGVADARVARARITRPDGEIVEAEFTVAQAKQARLWDTRETVKKKGKDGGEYTAPNDSAWFRFPDDMMGWKALGRAVRRGASDATRGLMIREDIEPEMVDVTQTPLAISADIPPDPDVPEPDIKPTVNSDESPDPAQDEPGAKAALTILADSLRGVTDKASRLDVWEGMADVIGRLPKADQEEAERIFEGEAP